VCQLHLNSGVPISVSTNTYSEAFITEIIVIINNSIM
jgi:hypothetical protein